MSGAFSSDAFPLLSAAHSKNLAARAAVTVLSLLFISVWAHSKAIAVFVAAIAIVSYLVMVAATRLPNSSSYRTLCNVALIGILFLSIPLLNVFGYVGTLTGSSADQVAQLPWLLGLPFLVLQIGAVWREVLFEGKLLPSFLDYLLLLVFLPKFISGPLERSALIEDFHNMRFSRGAELERAAGFILLGLFMKFTVANQISEAVHLEFVDPPEMLLSTVAFELRVYFDLAGYSFIALGGAALVGVNLTCNFRHPFYSPNVREFWQRWHVALGRWLHATVYQPIRNNCANRFVTACLLSCVVFVASAAWHGTTVNFFAWGLFHGLCYTAYTRFFRYRAIPRVVGIGAMIGVIVFGRMLFMDSDYVRLGIKIANLFDLNAWNHGLAMFGAQTASTLRTKSIIFTIIAAFGFIVCEGVSLRLYPEKPYQLFLDRRTQFVMLVLLLFFTRYVPAGLVYARQ